VGYIDRHGKKYHVQNGDCDEVAIVSSVDKAIPVLLDYYDKHPTRWQRYDDSFCASQFASPFGLLEVDQCEQGWSAHRHLYDCRQPLMRDGKPAIFETIDEAEHAAEAHLLDGLPGSGEHADGLSWGTEQEP
jgi:hypothetical protein